MKDNKEESNNFEPLFAGTVCLLLGYGWFSFWSEDGVDVFWIGDLVGWFFYVFGVLGIISGIIGFLKDIFFKRKVNQLEILYLSKTIIKLKKLL